MATGSGCTAPSRWNSNVLYAVSRPVRAILTAFSVLLAIAAMAVLTTGTQARPQRSDLWSCDRISLLLRGRWGREEGERTGGAHSAEHNRNAIVWRTRPLAKAAAPRPPSVALPPAPRPRSCGRWGWSTPFPARRPEMRRQSVPSRCFSWTCCGSQRAREKASGGR
eukprot:SAG11_NODE_4_length_33019_cov_28.098909_12_plen_166_part_00